jgi:hypothetical protein
MSEDYLAQAQPTLNWNTARGVWEKQGMVNLLCEHWELFSETWQTSGTMRNGKVYEPQTQAHLTTDSEFSSLPTPRAQNGEDRNNKIYARDPSQPQNLENALAVTLMPTPVAAEGTKAPSQQTSEVKRKTGQVWLSNVAKDMEQNTIWGKFEPAIRRWEQTLGRQAPSPTKPDGKDGNHRLSSKFTEWMMGLPSGWITEVGLSRNDELKACGNGVVPQQAELALRALLGNSELNKLQDNASLLPTVMANSPMRNSRRSMVTHPTKRSGVALNQALELISGVLPAEFESWDEVPANYQDINQTQGGAMLPTPTVSDTFTDNLSSTQQKEGSMHSVTLPQAVRMVGGRIEAGPKLNTPTLQTDNQSIGRDKSTAEDRQ